MNSAQLAQALAERNGLDYVDLNVFDVDKGAARPDRQRQGAPLPHRADRVPRRADAAGGDRRPGQHARARRHRDGDRLRGAARGRLARGHRGADQQLARSTARCTEDRGGGVQAQVIELRESADEAPIVKLVHSIIADAVRRGASDIHFEPRGRDMRVRFRVDGVVFDSTTVPRHLVAGLVSRIKIMAELDIAEKRVPQDGRIGLSVDGNHVDLRVATLPVVRGEAVVMRILDKRARSSWASTGSAWTRPTATASSTRCSADPRRHPRHRARPARARPPRSTPALSRAEHARQDDHDGRGPGRVRARRASSRCR